MEWSSIAKKIGRLGRGGGAGHTRDKAPVELPASIGMYLVTRLKLDPDWVWGLRCVIQPQGDSKRVRDVRVFSPNAARSQRVEIRGYHSLDEYPELILFDGWFDKVNHDCRINVRVK